MSSTEADIARDCTELLLGMRGTYEGETFELTGRSHVVSRGGGRWNEWRARFADGREGWLAEGATRFYFMFEAPLVDVDAAEPGGAVSAKYVACERDVAERVAAFGDAEPPDGTSYRYVDLSGENGKCATVDYGAGTPRTFTGRRVTLEEIALIAAREPVYPEVFAGAAPDSDYVVGTDISVQSTHVGSGRSEPAIATYRIIATVVRSAPDDEADENESERFVWTEHLLYKQGSGLVWLVELPDEHRLVTIVEPGAVDVRDGSARFEGASWKKARSSLCRTDGVHGQLPWAVKLGEEVTATDYTKKDRVLSVERSGREVVWALSSPLEESDLVYAAARTA